MRPLSIRETAPSARGYGGPSTGSETINNHQFDQI